MRLIIIADDNVISVDGDDLDGFDLTALDSNIHAVQWYDTAGEVEYKDGTANLAIVDITPYNAFVNAHAAERARITAIPAPTPLTVDQRFDAALDANPVLKAIFEELEASNPNLRANSKGRMPV